MICPHVITEQAEMAVRYCSICGPKLIDLLLDIAKEAKEVIKLWEWAEDDLPSIVPEYNDADKGWSQDFHIVLCRIKVALQKLEDSK